MGGCLIMAKIAWKNESDIARTKEINELKSYLQETDFYYLRKLETGEEVPIEVNNRRKASRKRLKELGL